MKRIGILRGGTGENYGASLRQGGELILYLNENLADKYKPVDILIDQDYIWHFGGLPVNPGDLVNKVDVVWNTSHPSFSNILESLSMPHVSPSSFSGILDGSKEMLRDHMKKINISMPRFILLPVYQADFDGPRKKYAVKKAKEVFEKFGSPWVVKSFTPDSSMGVHVAKTYPELVEAIEDGVKHEKSILIEELIMGKVAPVHAVAGFRGEDVYVFSLGNFSGDEKEKLISVAKDLYRHIGANHYLKSNFVITPRGKVSLLGIERFPDLRADSHFRQACENVGVKMHNVVEHILERAF